MTKQQIKHAFISLLIGALVAFITTLFQGVLHILQGIPSDAVGGVAGTVTYLVKNFRV